VDEDLRLDGVVTAWSYEDVPRRLVLALKYHARLEALPVLVAALGAAALAAGVPGDLVVPVPLSTRRRRERGYDQAALLARGLGRALGLEVRPRALLRRRYTPPQTTLPAARRRTSVRGAFRARPKGLRARSVLLVDDVLTTGGTLRAAATALRRAAVASVVAVVACRTERSR
jgi:ComF family protein